MMEIISRNLMQAEKESTEAAAEEEVRGRRKPPAGRWK